jgi:hypothetical protein
MRMSTRTRVVSRARALLVMLTITSAEGALQGCAPPAPERPIDDPSVPSRSAPGGAAGPASTPAGVTASAATATPAASAAPVAAPADGGAGGRLFDKWYEGKSFKPDDAKTPAVDGSGGPFDNGRLKSAEGKEASDTAGHQTRLKNLFGWDLRGADGIYGPKYQKKKYVLSINLLTTKASRDELVRWFTSGHEGIPAYGDVLAATEISEMVDFIVSMRDGKLARPEQVFELSTTAPGNYTLRPGGDPARGASLFKARCATCHGDDGTTLLFDGGELSLGMHSRQKAYEDWMKILNGQPGTAMGRQVDGTDGPAMAEQILDVLSALCDRRAFPKGKARGADVADGDARCGSYLR